MYALLFDVQNHNFSTKQPAHNMIHILVQVGKFCFNGCQCQLCILLIFVLNQPARMNERSKSVCSVEFLQSQNPELSANFEIAQ